MIDSIFYDNIKTIELNGKECHADGCAVAVGIFDGVHIGHRRMLSRLKTEAERLNVRAAVFSFDISDSPKGNRNLLATDEQKLSLLKQAGVDTVYSAPFSVFREMDARDFANELIFNTFGARSVVCGYDFRFGKDRSGDVSVMQEVLGPKNVSVITQPPLSENGIPVSSTYIRSLIADGNINEANRLLGREFSFSGEVIHGKKLGRTLGFPTVNQKYPQTLVMPCFGVYAVECVIDGNRYGGVANIGIKPTVGNAEEPLCESHIFGYSGDCYGKCIETYLVGFIRKEKRFDSLEELRIQVEQDKLCALQVLKRSVDR